MSLNPYLTFDGSCREAFDFYRSVFGGEFLAHTTFAEGPADWQVPEEEADRIMHVSLPIGDGVLMGSDTSSAFGPPPVVGTNFAISITGRSREHCDEIFAKLSAGGEIKMPMQDMFWGAYFGCWTDRFGVSWMINFDIETDST